MAIFLQGGLEGPSPWDSIASSELVCVLLVLSCAGHPHGYSTHLSRITVDTFIPRKGYREQWVLQSYGVVWIPGSVLTALPMQDSEHPHVGMDLIL